MQISYLRGIRKHEKLHLHPAGIELLYMVVKRCTPLTDKAKSASRTNFYMLDASMLRSVRLLC